MLHYKYIGHLFDALSGSAYQCEAGSLVNDSAFIVLREILHDRLSDEIPPALVEKYDLNSHLDDDGYFERLPPLD